MYSVVNVTTPPDSAPVNNTVPSDTLLALTLEPVTKPFTETCAVSSGYNCVVCANSLDVVAMVKKVIAVLLAVVVSIVRRNLKPVDGIETADNSVPNSAAVSCAEMAL